MKKYVKILLSAVLTAAFLTAPCSVSLCETAKLSDASEIVEAVVGSNAVKPTESTVDLSDASLDELQNENDVIYEPDEESITVMDDSSAYVNDVLTVFFNETATEEDKQAVVESLDGEVVGNIEYMNQYEIKIQRSDFAEINAVCDELMKNDSVEFASCVLATESEPDYIPDDPWNFPRWDDYANSGSYTSSNWWIKAIDADKAWDYKDKFSHIKIGVVDSGFDTEHEDLQGKIRFPSEFYAENNAPTSHGTHVAGIIGANHDNRIGISGIVDDCELICTDWQPNKEQGQKWNSDVRIMAGLINAVRGGAKVINFSLGSSGKITNGTTNRYKIAKDVEAKFTSYVVAKLLQKGYDFICCQSAGNGTTLKDGTFYAVDASNNGTFCTITKENAIKTVPGVTPQDIIDRIIIVGAASFDWYDTYIQASYSNGGSQVSICAPGTSVYSTYYDEDNPNHKYGNMSGTSMACPIVTGVASLVWSVNQSFTGAQVKHFVCDVENTKYIAYDDPDESHLPTGDIPMVNALLAVEAALRANGDLTDEDPVEPVDPETPAEPETGDESDMTDEAAGETVADIDPILPDEDVTEIPEETEYIPEPTGSKKIPADALIKTGFRINARKLIDSITAKK